MGSGRKDGSEVATGRGRRRRQAGAVMDEEGTDEVEDVLEKKNRTQAHTRMCRARSEVRPRWSDATEATEAIGARNGVVMTF